MSKRYIAPPGFEPGLQAPEARRLDRYLTGLSLYELQFINLLSSSFSSENELIIYQYFTTI